MSVNLKYVLAIMLFLCAENSLLSLGFSSYDYIVAKDGSGDFGTVQEAIDASKSFPDERITIFIKNGVYKEKIKVHSWNTKLSIIGENIEKTKITWDDYFDKINRGRNSTFYTYTMLVQGNDFHAENLTIENSAGEAGQAVALNVDADRVSFVNCRLIGNQDTLYLSGEGNRQYFSNCYIEGTTDFIFGGATALFEQCHIHSKKNSYITAASTPKGIDFGFVFKSCKLTADPGVNEVYLGRPWRNYAKTVFIDTKMDGHILSAGWHNWEKPKAEKTAFYAEFENNGPGFAPEKRVHWSRQLTEKQAKRYTQKYIFGNWKPAEHARK